MATIKEIAERAGMSRRTVDRVINNRGSVKPETAETIRQIIKELNYTPNTVGRNLAANKKKLRLLFCSTTGSQSLIYEPIREGARTKASTLREFGVTTDFLTINRDQPLNKEQISEIVNNLNYDGIAISPLTVPGIPEIIAHAQETDIPLVFYNTDSSEYERLCFVGCDYIKAGRIAAGLAALSSNDSGKVCILTTKSANRDSFFDRVAGFESELNEKYPKMQIVANELLEGDQFDCYDKIKKIIDFHPDIDVIYLVNPGDYSSCYVISKAFGSKKVRIITNDLLEINAPALKSGLIAATIDQNPQKQGSIPLEILYNHLAINETIPSDIIYTDLSIVIGQTLDQRFEAVQWVLQSL